MLHSVVKLHQNEHCHALIPMLHMLCVVTTGGGSRRTQRNR